MASCGSGASGLRWTPQGARIHFWGKRSASAALAVGLATAASFAAGASGSQWAPNCYDPTVEVEHGETAAIYGCWDQDQDPLTYTITDQPDHGTVTGPDSGNQFRYKPADGYTGQDSFSYTVSDGTNTVPATVTLNVVPYRDDAPYCHAWGGYGSVEAGDDHPVYVSCTDDEGTKVAVSVTDGPDHGTVGEPNQYGTFIYKSAADFVGQDSITFKGNDGAQDSQPTTVTFDVVAAKNDPPDCYSVYRYPGTGPYQDYSGPIEGGEKAYWFAQCSDDEGDKLTPRVTDPPEHGSVAIESGGLAYTAGHGHQGTDTFKFVMNDGVNDSQEQSVSIDVRPNVDDPPKCAAAVNISVEQGDAASVYANCYDDEAAQLTYSVVEGHEPEHGTIAPGQWGAQMYTPDVGYEGPDEAMIRVSDGTNAVDIPVNVTVTASTNDPPRCFIGWISSGVGFGGSGSVENNETQRFGTNCMDDEGDRLTIKIVKQPQHGTLEVVDEQELRYTPDSTYTGSESFSIRGHDGKVDGPESQTMTFNVVAAQDDPPSCVGYARGSFGPFGGAGKTEAGERNPVTIQCHDDEGATVTPAPTVQPEHGTLTDEGIGYWTYEPENGFRGRDQFKFKGSTAAGQESSEVTVPIDVIDPVNDPPMCSYGPLRPTPGFGGMSYSLDSGETTWLGLGCSDDEADAITLEVTDQPDHGSVEVGRDRPRAYPFGGFDARLSYTPDEGYTGSDSIKFRGSDGTNQTQEFTVNFTVGAAHDDPPICNWSSGFAKQPSSPTKLDLNQACADPEGAPLEFEITRQPQHGDISGPDSEGRFTLTPDPGTGNLRDDLAFRASDGTHTTAVQKGYIYPALGATCYLGTPQRVIAPGTSLTLGAADLCQGDTTGHKVRRWITPPAHGTLASNGDGTVTYTPAPGFSGTDAFDIVVEDGTRVVTEVRMKVQVGGPPNAAPTCRDTSLHVLRDTVTAVPLPCSDPDGDGLRIQRVPGSGPAHGRLGPIDSGEGRVKYRPNAGFLGEDAFSFQADDGLASSASALARLIVVADGAGRDVAPGETVSTGDEASDADPLTAAVTSPVAGRVAVFEGPPANDAPNGYSFLGQEISIQAPRGTPESPLKLVFQIDAALLPPGSDPASLVVFRNGVPVETCSGAPGHASPTPCVAGREVLPDGNLKLTILTVEASRWNLGTGAGDDGGGGNDGGGGTGTGGNGTGDTGNGTGNQQQQQPGDTNPGPTTQPPPGDTSAPSVKLKVVKGQKLRTMLKSGLRVEASCSEACTGTATLTLDAKLAKKLKIPAKLGTVKIKLAAAGKRVVVVKLGKKARAALARTKRASIQISARAADGVGNAAAAKPVKLTLAR
jgi:hypothetical protein